MQTPGNSLQQIRAKLRDPAPFQGMPGEFVRLPGGRVAAGSGGRGAPDLGTYAKSSSPPPSTEAKKRVLRAQRYELLAGARGLLYQEARAGGHQYASGFHRTSGCCYLARGSVDVLHDHHHDTAFYAGLTTCGSVWACPVCSAKIQERRRAEIGLAMERARAEGLQPVMVTLTHPHRAWHRLEGMLEQQADALRRLRSGKAWQGIKARHGFQGLIRSLEVTHGKNGWHPHTHELWFVSRHCDAEALRLDVARRWRAACQRAGLLDEGDAGFDEHSVDVRGWCDTSDYLAKMDDQSHWGADRELAKGASKGSKGVHPFGLLTRHRDGCERSGRLFVEYATATRGKRQLFWSQGLKARWGIEELSDQEVNDRQDNPADVLGRLRPADWQVIRRYGYQAPVLEAAEDGGWAAVQALLAELRARTQPRSALGASCAGTGGDPAGGPGSPGPAAPRGSGRPSGRSRTAAGEPSGPSGPADAPAQQPVGPQPPVPAGSGRRRAAREARLQHRLYGPPLPD
jgi:hypothetical protein